MSAAGEDRRYVRAVEEAWSRLRARPTVLSPRDFEIVDGWRRRGIPLGVVLEVLDHQAKRRIAGGRRSLAYLSTAVEAAWVAVAGGRSTAAGAASTESPSRNPWSDALARTAPGTPLNTLLRELEAEAEAGATAGDLDLRLDEALPRVAPPELLATAERDALDALAPFRSRMLPEEFGKTLTRARADRLRAALSLPRSAGAR